jgi:hypothetical protein
MLATMLHQKSELASHLRKGNGRAAAQDNAIKPEQRGLNKIGPGGVQVRPLLVHAHGSQAGFSTLCHAGYRYCPDGPPTSQVVYGPMLQIRGGKKCHPLANGMEEGR